jgi:uncharacterized protein
MTFLLEVNVLVSLHDPLHPHYRIVSDWFQKRGRYSFATCPITQSGLLRLLLRGIPGVAQYQILEARDALQNLTGLAGHVFWPDVPGYLDSTRAIFSRMEGHRQITDAYLLGLAIHNRGMLATLDAGIRHLAGSDFASNVEWIQHSPRT